MVAIQRLVVSNFLLQLQGHLLLQHPLSADMHSRSLHTCCVSALLILGYMQVLRFWDSALPASLPDRLQVLMAHSLDGAGTWVR